MVHINCPLAWIILLILFASELQPFLAVTLNRSCPVANIDAQTGRCKVKIAFVPQDIFAFPVLNGQVADNSESLAQDAAILKEYTQLHVAGQSFSDDAVRGCKDVTQPCPAIGVDTEFMSKVFNEMLDWEYTLVPYYTYPSALYAARVGVVDMTWAALAITATREACNDCPLAPESILASSLYSCCVDFSYPYWEGGLAVVSKSKKAAHFHDALFTKRMLNVFSLFIIFLVIVGHIMWFIESRSEFGQVFFPRPYTKGVFQGIYWACTTATTVGYGDTGPTTGAGKIFTMMWMFVGIVFAGILSGVMASALTLDGLQTSGITHVDQLDGKRVCFIAGYYEEWLTKQAADVRVRKSRSLAECFTSLDQGDVDAVLYDKPLLDRYQSIGRFGPKFGVSDLLTTADYGVAFPEGSPLTHRISAGLLHLLDDSNFLKDLQVKWMGFHGEDTTSNHHQEIDWVYFIISIALLVWLAAANLCKCVLDHRSKDKRKASRIDSEPWRSPAFNEMEEWLHKAVEELKSQHDELTKTHQELASDNDALHNRLKQMQRNYAAFTDV